MYENWDSQEKERPVCRSLAVVKKISDHENNLKEAIEACEFYTLHKALTDCHGIDIDVKLKKKAED